MKELGKESIIFKNNWKPNSIYDSLISELSFGIDRFLCKIFKEQSSSSFINAEKDPNEKERVARERVFYWKGEKETHGAVLLVLHLPRKHTIGVTRENVEWCNDSIWRQQWKAPMATVILWRKDCRLRLLLLLLFTFYLLDIYHFKKKKIAKEWEEITTEKEMRERLKEWRTKRKFKREKRIDQG